MKMIMTISRANPPTVLLENGSMVRNQMNADRNENVLSKRLTQMALKAKMETNTRSAHHVPKATRNISRIAVWQHAFTSYQYYQLKSYQYNKKQADKLISDKLSDILYS